MDILDLVTNKSTGDILSGLGQLLIGLGMFGNMWISYCGMRVSKQNASKIKEVHISSEVAAMNAQAAADMAQQAVVTTTTKIADVKAVTLQVRDEVIAAVKNGGSHK